LESTVTTPTTDRRRGDLVRLGLISLVVIAALAAQRPPAVVPATAPPQAVSAERASAIVATLAPEPHPTGSAANRAVRDALLAALADLGLETEVQRTVAVSERFGGATAALVENVLGRLHGHRGDAAVLLVAHYDSVPTGPGAADNMAAVAAILEALRAITSGAPLANDVIVLFSDAEEIGLLGAEAFAAEHPWMADVGLVVNLEARGSSGPSVLVETSGPSHALMRAFAAVVPYPNASSLATAVYELLPNDTDFTVFAERGLPGFNLAFIRDAAHYHTPRDALDTLSLGSLQHHAEHVLAVTRHFGDADLSALAGASGDAVFVDVLRRWIVRYPQALALPLALVAAALWIAVTFAARRRGFVRLRGVALGAGAALLAAALVVGLGIGLVELLEAAQPALAERWIAAPYRVETAMAGLALAALACTWFVARTARLAATPLALGLGGALVWTVLAVASALFLPGASYLPTLPVLGALAAALAVVASSDRPGRAPWHAWALTVGALPTLVLVPPFIAEGFIALGVHLAAPALVLTALAAWSLTPLLDALRGPRSWLLPVLLVGASAGMLVAGAQRAAFSERQPAPSHAAYVADPGAGVAYFVGPHPGGDEWSRAFMDATPTVLDAARALLPGTPVARAGVAPVLDLATPVIDVLADTRSGDERRRMLRVGAGHDAIQLNVHVRTAAPLDVVVAGRMVQGSPLVDGWHTLRLHGPMAEGMTIELITRGDAPLELALVAVSYDLLAHVGLGLPPRPQHLMTAPSRLGDAVLVRRTWTLE
jgi:hypothetical protein